MTYTCYLDIGASRIQAWLARTDMLRLRRGASMLLDDATSLEGVLAGQGSPSGLSPNEEAAAVSGVIHLKVSADDPEEAEERAARHASSILTSLRREVPAVTWLATWVLADSYQDARQRVTQGQAAGRQLSLPGLAEVPVARLCDTCGAGTAALIIDLPGISSARVCSDCAARAAHSGDTRRLPSTVRTLMAELGDDERGIARDMEQLARMGDDTQTALIFADGNRVGDYMARRVAEGAAKAGGAELTAATWTALATAVRAISGDDSEPWPIVPHLVGGDDILVSVPAAEGWRFSRELMASFQRCFSTTEDPPSLSVGMVFAHASMPFAMQLKRAEELLSEAKGVGHGRATIAWADETAGYPADPHDSGTAITDERLAELASDLSEFSSWPRSMRGAITGAGEAAVPHARRSSAKHAAVVQRLEESLGLEKVMVMSRWWA